MRSSVTQLSVSAGSNLKDGQPHIVPVDVPMTDARDDKSSSSSQSHSNSRSCSNGNTGNVDARSSSAGSMNRSSGGSSRSRNSLNVISGSPSGVQSSPLLKNRGSEKVLQPAGDASTNALNGKEATEESSLHPTLEVDETLPSTSHVHSESVKGSCGDVMLSSEKISVPKAHNADETDTMSCSSRTERQRSESNDPIISLKQSVTLLVISKNHVLDGPGTVVTDHNSERVEGRDQYAANSRKWLDLNAGADGGLDIEGRDMTLPLAPWTFPVASSQALAEEQARMSQMPGGSFKRSYVMRNGEFWCS